MKRILSVILTICMMAAFVPAVSAEAADAQPNFTINYDITGDLAATNAASFKAIDLEYTNGFYALGVDGSTGTWGGGDFKAYGSGSNTNVVMRSGSDTCVKVWVPMAGTYKLNVYYATGETFTNDMRVFWDTKRQTTYSQRKGTYKGLGATGDQFQTISATPFGVNVTADAPGYYYVTLQAAGTYSNNTRASFATISLESGNGDGNAIVLGGIDEAFELNTTDNKTKQLTASGYLSQTREAVTFKYESSDNSVATVDENGLVTAVGAGEATITATSADDGDNVTVPLTTKVTVTDPTAYAVTYDIGGTIIKYKMQKTSSGASDLHMSNVKYLHTNGFFEYVAADPTVNGTSSNAEYQSGTKTLAMNKASGYVTFKINVPYDGEYKLWMDHDLALQGGYVDVYIGNTRVGSYNCYNSAASKNWFGLTGSNNHTQSIAKTVNGDGTLGDEAIFHLAAGEHTIKFQNRTNTAVTSAIRGSVGTFKLIKGGSDAVKVMHGYATVSRNGVPVTSLTNGEVLTANAAVYTTDAVATAPAATITSSNPGVLKVEGTTVTAVGTGEATINATIEYQNETYNIESNKILVTDPAITANTVSFYADANVNDVNLTIVGIDYTQGNVDGTASANTTVTLTAPTDIEGKTFRGWMRGSEDNGVWISNESKISVTLVSNTFLTAVYDAEVAEDKATVEFWNWSGQYLGSKTVDKETKFGEVTEPDIHDLTGYEFAGWSVADNEIVSGLTRAVAQFTKSAGNYNVTIPENVGGAATGDFEFDTKVTLTSENPVYWQRDGKTVDYGTEYSFYVWDDTKISISDKGNSAPKVILDKHDDYGTYMIEFDKGEATNMRILEAGILFGNDPKVNSFDSKAVASGRDLTHGQFTAIANTANGGASNAVGYIVYLDGGIARVLYAK